MQDLKEVFGGKGIYRNFDLVSEFNENHGYELISGFADSYNDLINEIKAIKRVIDVLEDWKKESWFKLHETPYEINFFDCDRARRDNLPIRVTLPKAKQMLKESLIRYETLNSIFKDIKNVFGKDDAKYLDKYFNIAE